MKSVNILGVHGKIRVLEGVFTKNQYMGSVGLPKKGGLGKFANLREGLGKKEGWVGCFWEGAGTPIHIILILEAHVFDQPKVNTSVQK